MRFVGSTPPGTWWQAENDALAWLPACAARHSVRHARVP